MGMEAKMRPKSERDALGARRPGVDRAVLTVPKVAEEGSADTKVCMLCGTRVEADAQA